MTVALAFPGQGSEEPEMGLALARADARARRLLELASEATGLDVPRALARGSRALTRTEVIQPVLVAVGLGFAHAHAAREGAPDVVLGHSLGELTAALFALDVTDEQAIAVARARGVAMAEASARSPGGMLAVRARTDDDLVPLLASGLALAAVNAGDERVLAGPPAELARVERSSGLETRRLAVAGPWHHPSMAPAREALAPLLAGLRADEPWPAARPRLASAVTADLVAGPDVGHVLTESLVRPVLWARTVEQLVSRGLSRVVVVPPSRVLASLLRRGPARSLVCA